MWSFVHGNHNACAINHNTNHIQPLIAKSLSSNIYCPQVSFIDCKKFGIILNNPLLQKPNLRFIYSKKISFFLNTIMKFNHLEPSLLNLKMKISPRFVSNQKLYFVDQLYLKSILPTLISFMVNE